MGIRAKFVAPIRSGWQSGDAQDCKSFNAGSTPAPDSNFAPVAQTVERQLEELRVAGPNPAGGTTLHNLVPVV